MYDFKCIYTDSKEISPFHFCKLALYVGKCLYLLSYVKYFFCSNKSITMASPYQTVRRKLNRIMQPKNSHDLRLKLAFVCKIIKCYLLVTRIQQITFRFFSMFKTFIFYKISLFCNRSILSGNRSIWQNTDRPFLLRIVKEKLSVYVIKIIIA